VTSAVADGNLDQVTVHRVLPVVVLDHPDQAAPLADALVAGGLPCAEVTLRSAAALAAIDAMASRGDILVGAGTVLSVNDVDNAVRAGARFLVSPGVLPHVIERAQALEVPILPGVITPSDIMSCLHLGLSLLKLFPAAPSGGLALLDALAAPFPQVRFVPTGGITAQTAGAYLQRPAVPAVGGSWMVSPADITARRFDLIRRLTAQTVGLLGR